MENRRIIRSVGVVGGFTTLSRVLGLIRDVVMAGYFGASTAMSAFVVAFTMPNLFRRLFGEGALSRIFYPHFCRVTEKGGDAQAGVLARRVITLLALVLVILAGLGMLACTILIAYPSFTVRMAEWSGRPELLEIFQLVYPLLRIMFPYVVCICLVALAMGILNAFHHFAVPASTPCLLNITWIVGVLFIAPLFGDGLEDRIHGVSWVIVVAGVFQLLYQFPILRRFGYQPGLEWPGGDPRVKRVLHLMGPAALGMAVTQFNVVLDRVLAAWVGPHAPAALFFSERMIYLPLGVFATALGTVLLPVLSGHAADNSRTRALQTVNHSLRLILFVMVPAAVGLLILAEPIIRMIYEWKSFTPSATWYTATALQFYAPGLLVFSLAKVFVPAFYANQDTKTPVKIGVMTVGLNLVLNLVFVMTWPEAYKHAGLACATVISEGVYALVLGGLIHRRYGSPGWASVFKSFLRILIAAAAMGVAVFLFARWIPGVLSWTGKPLQIVTALGSVVCGLVVYVLLAWLLRMPEFASLTAALRRRK